MRIPNHASPFRDHWMIISIEHAQSARKNLLEDGYCVVDDAITTAFLSELRDWANHLLKTTEPSPDWKYQGSDIKINGLRHGANNTPDWLPEVYQGLPAKPKIDMCAVCTTDFPSDEEHQRILDLGYTLSDHCEALGHSAYNLDHELPAYTIHWYRENHVGLRAVLWFRDQLLKDPQLCLEYAEIKRTAVKNNPEDRWAYTRHKDPFIQKVMSAFPDGNE